MKQFKHLSIAVLAFTAFTAHAQNYRALIADYMNQSPSFKSSKTELRDFVISNEDHSRSLKGTVLQIQQVYNQIPIYGSVASALVQNNQVIYFTDNFEKKATATAGKATKGTPENIFVKMMDQLQLDAQQYSFAKDSKDFVSSKTVYFPAKNTLNLSYEYEFYEKNSDNLWNIVADAYSGEILSKLNLTLSCTFSDHPYGRHSHEGNLTHSFIGPEQNSKTNTFIAPDNASYRVYALPVEAPTFGARKLVSNPWDLNASPEGWHSTITNSYTYTRGNNVYAYVDANSSNTVGAVAEGGANRVFDFPLEVNSPYLTYQNAAITNLFYMNNMMHDISYKFGFNEGARNFQTNNFGKGGFGNDAVLAEARDGSTLATMNMNNANFSTPSDGGAGRMQMYLWTPKYTNRLFFNSPSPLANSYPATQRAAFGPALTATGVSGDLATTTPADGCSAINEDLTGKIGIIVSGGIGGCTFANKVKNAQLKGAKGVVIYNAAGTTAFSTMTGADATITIPSILVENSTGTMILSQMQSNTINVTLKDNKQEYLYLDGDLDNGIIAHEYGHGISNRNTGDGYSCLSSSNANEQMGEGWSDFFALMLTNSPGDNASVARGIGTFAKGQETNGMGIRPARYSPNFAENNFTYGNTNGMTTVNSLGQTVPHVHSIGFVWATMLWDLHWKFVEKYGYSSDVTANPNSGSAKVFQAVMDGMKLQGCNPSFIKGRDAIIAADAAANPSGQNNRCMIWSVFAKRGLGVNANPGLTKPTTTSSANVIAALSDQVEDFTTPADCAAELATASNNVSKTISIFPNPAKNEVFFKTNVKTQGKVFVTVYDVSGKNVLQDKIDMNNGSLNLSSLPNGVYIVKGEGMGVQFTEKIIIKK